MQIAINGFGRIGRNIFRILHQRKDIQVVAISDTADHKALEYLVKYDTIRLPVSELCCHRIENWSPAFRGSFCFFEPF